jgi:HK97 family phage major capsid protein
MTPRIAPRPPLVSDMEAVGALGRELRRELFRGSRASYDEYRSGKTTGESASFWKYMTAPALFTEPEEILEDHEYRVLSKAASGGGFLVPEEVSSMVISAARSVSPIARLAQEWVTDKGDTLGVPIAGTHGTASWVAESGAITPSDDTLTQVNLGAFKGNAKLIASEELRTDSEVDLDRFLAVELGQRIGLLEAAAFATGDGSGKPTGAVSAASTFTVSTAPVGNVTAYSKAAILQFFLALGADYRAEASWVMHPTDFANLAALEHASGGLSFPGLQADPPSMLGRPVYMDASLPAPAASAKSLLVGNFRLGYGVRRVRDISIQRQVEIHADTGGIGYRLFSRVDGKPLLPAAVLIGAHSAT